MDATKAEKRRRAEAGNEPRERVSAHRSSPDRVVFTEAENSDGWIALDADVAVTVER